MYPDLSTSWGWPLLLSTNWATSKPSKNRFDQIFFFTIHYIHQTKFLKFLLRFIGTFYWNCLSYIFLFFLSFSAAFSFNEFWWWMGMAVCKFGNGKSFSRCSSLTSCRPLFIIFTTLPPDCTPVLTVLMLVVNISQLIHKLSMALGTLDKLSNFQLI